jgi:hypothetical protein
MPSRRQFVFQILPVAAIGGLVARDSFAQAKLAETDAQAVALGYKADGSKVDKAKFPKYAADQHCGVCALYQGKPTDAAAACSLFAGKQVPNKGWCNAFTKKG